jgi:uncharacterized protein (DUF736 family)
MPQIGELTREKKGYSGRIHTLILNLDITIIAAEASETENAPDYRIHIGDDDGPEIGAGWKRTGEKAGLFVSILLDDPTFAQPIRANLFQNGNDKTSWSLHWNRQQKRDAKD